MRIALIVHGLPPEECTGVETHVDALAAALARAGARVSVLAARRRADLPHLALRSERRAGFTISWLNLAEAPRDVLEEADPPGVAAALDAWLALECPEVVHVHHLRGLGWGVLEAVHARGLPLLFTAHDDYTSCHRVTRLRPDMARCEASPEPALCSRCDRAAAHLHGRPELGDWHMGVWPEQLTPAARAGLAAILAGQGEADSLARSEELRARADGLRAAALARVDRFFAPTRRVADTLLALGVPAERLCVQPYGIEVAALRDSQRTARDPHRLRVGYFGGLSKHKGAHILVEACADLPGVALELHGDSSDRPYVEGLRARCREVGVRWRGAYAAGQLAERLAGVDLVCVPSLWLENAPFVIREAFAAGRPVLASHLGALPESVRDGVDGRLLPAGDVAAWRTALAELAAEPERLAALARGVRPPRELDDLAAELLDSYTLLCEREPQPARELPEHLATFQARRTALAGEPFADLLERVRNDVARLRGRLGLPPGPASGDALASARARDLLRDERAALAWQRQVAADDRAAREHLQAEAVWLRDLLQQREREIEAAGQECSQLESARSAEEAERDWLREILAALERERDWLREQLAELQRERDEHAALRAHERWLSAEAQRLLAALGALDEQQPQAGDHTALARALAQAPERAASLLAELAWRRVQMEQA